MRTNIIYDSAVACLALGIGSSAAWAQFVPGQSGADEPPQSDAGSMSETETGIESGVDDAGSETPPPRDPLPLGQEPTPDITAPRFEFDVQRDLDAIRQNRLEAFLILDARRQRVLDRGDYWNDDGTFNGGTLTNRYFSPVDYFYRGSRYAGGYYGYPIWHPAHPNYVNPGEGEGEF